MPLYPAPAVVEIFYLNYHNKAFAMETKFKHDTINYALIIFNAFFIGNYLDLNKNEKAFNGMRKKCPL